MLKHKEIQVFEACLLITGLIGAIITKPQLLPNNIQNSIILGIVAGVIISVLTFIYIQNTTNKSSLSFIFHFHKTHLSNNFLANYIIAPIAVALPEELFFRGFLLSKAGFLITNIIFTFLHALRFKEKNITILSIFFYGSVFSYLCMHTGALLAPFLAHYTFTLCRIYWVTKYIKRNPNKFRI
jgi:membrane protease YdiL (CAAX protease family)